MKYGSFLAQYVKVSLSTSANPSSSEDPIFVSSIRFTLFKINRNLSQSECNMLSLFYIKCTLLYKKNKRAEKTFFMTMLERNQNASFFLSLNKNSIN